MTGRARWRRCTGAAILLLGSGFSFVALAASFDLTRRAGLYDAVEPDSVWFQLADSTLAVGDSLTLVTNPELPADSTEAALPPRLTTATIAKRWGRATARILQEGMTETVYLLRIDASDEIQSTIGFGVVCPRSRFSIHDGRVESDVDADGLIERYSQCSSIEGLLLEIWEGRPPYRGESAVLFYYHVGYDLEPTCPEVEDDAVD